MSHGTTLHLIGNTSFYLKTQRKKWENATPNHRKQETRDKESQA